MNKSAVVLSFTTLCLMLIVVVYCFKTGFCPAGPQQSGESVWTPVQQRMLANRLKSAGLNLQAIQEYEKYTATAPLDKKQLASLSYTIGKMYMEEAQYEKALSWFYRVEIADPETQLKADVGSKIINCLERSGKYNAAEYSLSRRSSQKKAVTKKDGKIVAEIGEEKIYLEDINNAIDSMPEGMRKQFEEKKAKAEFLKKYVADELLYRKAVKLEYDKAPDMRKKLKQIEKELMVNKVLEHELKDKIKLEEDDLRNFFEAHKKDYIRKEAVKVSLIKAGMKEISDRIIEELKNGKDFSALARDISLDKETAKNGGEFNGWIRKGEDDLGIGNVSEISNALFAAKEGEITQAVKAGGYYYLFRIDKKRPSKVPTFEEAKNQVQNDYYMHKLKTSYQHLLDQILKTSDVKLFPEAVIGGGSS